MVSQNKLLPTPDPGPRQLIAVLNSALAGVPQNSEDAAHRTKVVMSAKTSLGRFGIDGESFIRYGMPSRAAIAIYRAMFSPDDDDLTRIIDRRRWREVLKVPTPSARLADLHEAELEAMSDSLRRVPHLLDMWVANAKFSEILRYTPPSDADWAKWTLLPTESNETVEAYHWLLQRSVLDTLDRWSIQSLHLEFKWQNKHQMSLFNELALGEAGPSRELLNGEIARRAVEPKVQEQIEQDQLFWQLQETAVDYLRKNKYLEATTLFEFHLRRNPHDARTLNNLGFCSIPLSPSKALRWLEDAAANGYTDVPINLYNQCCCLVQLNRAGEALDRAESYWQRQRQSDSPGVLWVRFGDEWTLEGDCSAEQALVRLAILAAREVGREDRAARWEERRQELESAPAAHAATRDNLATETGAA